MSTTTCPHCGGPIAPSVSTCQYCGSAVAYDTPIITAPSWISVDDELPKPSSADPDRSIAVLVCTNVDVLSAYYDFERQEWHNDEILVEDKELYIITHWMHIPYTQDDSRWISVVDRLPLDTSGKHYFADTFLTCIKGSGYRSSIISSSFSFKEKSWDISIVYDVKLGNNNWPLTHWMPMPELPEE